LPKLCELGLVAGQGSFHRWLSRRTSNGTAVPRDFR
jgi:hypothetical protein